MGLIVSIIMQTYAVVTKHFGIIPNVIGYVKMDGHYNKIKVYNSDSKSDSKDWKWCTLSRKPEHLAKAHSIGSQLRTFEDENGYVCMSW